MDSTGKQVVKVWPARAQKYTKKHPFTLFLHYFTPTTTKKSCSARCSGRGKSVIKSTAYTSYARTQADVQFIFHRQVLLGLYNLFAAMHEKKRLYIKKVKEKNYCGGA